MEFNKFQSTLEELKIDSYPQEIKDDFYDFINTVPYIKSLTSPNRPYAKDCPRDSEGKIIVDLTNPPIIEDTDYFRPTALYFQKNGCINKLRPNPNPNSEYGKWLREEVRRCFKGYIRSSDGAWVTGDMYFFLNYCPIIKVKRVSGKKGVRVVDFPDFQEGQWLKFMYIQIARDNAKHGSELASRGKGKAHPYDEVVYTPDGIKQWGDIQVGDTLFGDDGNTTTVTEIPFDDMASIYEVTLSNGYRVKCSEGHLWKVIDNDGCECILNTIKLITQGSSRYTIPVCKGVEFNYTKTEQNPYKYGNELYLRLQSSSAYTDGIDESYKINSQKVRLEVLKGILGKKEFNDFNEIRISVFSERFVHDIQWLCASLGIVTSKPICYINNNKVKYRICLYGSKVKGYSIDNIRYVGEEKAKCVTVDNESHCYLINNFIVTHNSYTMAAIAAKRFILGELDETTGNITKHVETFIASYLKNYLNEDGVLNKFESYIDFCEEYTQFPRKRLQSSINNMHWQMGYKQNGSEAKKGSLNEVIGISVKDSAGKLRGKRGAFIGLEEMGSFPNLIELYGTLRPSMEDGDIVFGQIYSQGTAGDTSSDFSAAQQIMYSPRAFNMQPIKNIYDKVGQGKPEFVYFYPAYVNRNGCQNKDGISDVTKALLEILINRYNVKYNSNNANLITKTIAEHPIVPQEAVLRTMGNLFPTTQLNERINQLDSNPNVYDDVLVGELVQSKNGEVHFKPTNDIPIREWPTKDNKEKGAIEIFTLPQKDNNGKVYPNRYIMGHDPVDDDVSQTMSLTSTFVLDLFTDQIVAEYTGRQQYADENFEIVRKLCIFYNAKCLYEQNKKGIFAYFSKMNCIQMLADTPEYLKEQQIIKDIGYGNKHKGVGATAAVNNFADQLTREWLIKPVTINDEEKGEITIPNLMFIKNRAFLQELSSYNPQANFDRIRAFGMLMLYRQEKIIIYQGDMKRTVEDDFDSTYAGNDEFFITNFDNKFGSKFSE